MVRISVITPVYNVESYLAECLDSVISALKGIRAEIICVDDGSTDGSAGILTSYVKIAQQNGIDFVYLKQNNQGVSKARNAALDVAKGEWICFVDSDDVWAPWAARNFLKLVDLDEELDLVQLTGKRFVTNDDYPWIKNGSTDEITEVLIQSDQILRNKNIDRGFAKTCFHRESIKTLRFKEYKIGEDRLFLIEALLCARKVAIGTCDMYGYRTRPGSAIQSSMSIGRIQDTLDYIQAMFIALKDSGRIAEPDVTRVYLNKIIEEIPYEIQKLKGSSRNEAWDYWRMSLQYFRNNVYPKNLRQSLIFTSCKRKINIWIVILLGIIPYWLKSKGFHR